MIIGLDDPSVRWLLGSDEPAVRYLTLRDALCQPEDSVKVAEEEDHILMGPKVRTLLSGQLSDGGFGVHPYQKWTGAHWRLVSLVELGIPVGYPPAVKATELVLNWLLSEAHRKNVPKINGLYRRCASQEGNALAVCSRLGLSDDPRVSQLAESLIEWQWPDGGWNCDRKEEARHSSFNESLSTLWGLAEYHNSTGNKDAGDAAEKAAEFFLRHRVYKSCRSNQTRRPETFHGKMFRGIHAITELHYPLYWHYDLLQALVILSRAGKMSDPRVEDALTLLESKRRPDGTWAAEGYYWSLKRTTRPKFNVSNVEVVDWGRKGPNEMITLNALRVLARAASD